MRVAQDIRLTKKQRMTLERWSEGRAVSVRQSERARMILHAAGGMQNREIAIEMGVKALTVGRWRSRFAESGLVGIEKDLPRGGRPRNRRERCTDCSADGL